MNCRQKLKDLAKMVRTKVRDDYGDLFLEQDNKEKLVKREEVIRKETRAALDEIEDKSIIEELFPSEIEDYVLSHLIGLGDLEPLFKDQEIREIMLNKPDEVYIDNGSLILTDIKFESVDEIMNLLQRMVQMSGRRVDFSHPIVNARLTDGTRVKARVNAVIMPVCNYPVISIRKFVKHKFTEDELLQQGYLNEEMLTFLEYAVRGKLNIVVCGAAGSGKTTFLRFLSTFISKDERLIVIEDTRELELDNPHVVSLESTEKVGIYELMVNSLRMRPDRIILGECRGMETFELLQAMGTGHDGSLTTVHSNYGKLELVQRLVRAMLKSGMSDRELTRHIISSLDLTVFIKKYNNGSWRIVNISEVIDNNGEPKFKDIYQYDAESKKHLNRGCVSEIMTRRIKNTLWGEELPAIAAFKRGQGD